jgi:hypothetical protein
MTSQFSADVSAPFLLSLPNELLEKIARECPCSTVLSLMRVNRQLYAICNNRLLFKYLVERPASGPTITSDDLPWYDASDDLLPISTAGMMRIAYALEHAGNLPARLEPFTKLSHMEGKSRSRVDGRLAQWLPHLCALRHPTALAVNPVYIFDRLTEGHNDLSPTALGIDPSSEYSKTFENLNFALVATTLAWNKRRFTSSTVILIQFAEYMNESDGSTETGGFDPSEVTMFFLYQLGKPEDGRTSRFSATKATATVMTMLTAILDNLGHRRVAPLPSIDRIPFHSVSDVPLPYTLDPFNGCHIPKMATADFLDGEWLGYYADNRGARLSMTLDRPMASIPLRATLIPGGHGSQPYIDIETVPDRPCSDAHGPFQLRGNIEMDGLVHLRKTYLNTNWQWDWRGYLCPFGMVGAWGNRGDGFGGYFWIWKKEWCEDGYALG